MARFKLETSIDPDVMVIGISCHENDYRLCWALNRQLGLALTRRRDDIQEPGPRAVSYHSVYDHSDERDLVRYTLINNHGAAGLLLKEQRSADFFLLADREVVVDEKELLERVRGTELVLAVFPLAFNDLKAGHKLLA